MISFDFGFYYYLIDQWPSMDDNYEIRIAEKVVEFVQLIVESIFSIVHLISCNNYDCLSMNQFRYRMVDIEQVKVLMVGEDFLHHLQYLLNQKMDKID
jgi:hypothetical protein